MRSQGTVSKAGWREYHSAFTDRSPQRERRPHADNVNTGNSAKVECTLFKMIISFLPLALKSNIRLVVKKKNHPRIYH